MADHTILIEELRFAAENGCDHELLLEAADAIERMAKKKMTNGDRIRTMSNLELTEWYCRGRTCDRCRYSLKGYCDLMNWLKEETDG